MAIKDYKYETILKLNKIFKLGYVPSRGKESYEEKNSDGLAFCTLINCFGHACFNLKNSQLEVFDCDESRNFGNHIEYPGQPNYEIARNLFDFIKAVGLKVRRVGKNCIPGTNQWLVALYFAKSMFDGTNQDYHFMLREKDGIWSHKMGHKKTVDYCSKPPRSFVSNAYYRYTLYGYFLLSNPYAKSKDLNLQDAKFIEAETEATEC